MAVPTIPEDEELLRYERAQADLRATKFPALVEVEHGDAILLKCPRCEEILSDEEVYAVSPAEDWATLDGYSPSRRIAFFYTEGHPELGETLYYKHGDNPGHAISLPEKWTEERL